MRKVSLAAVIGIVLAGCGGEETPPPATPTAPPPAEPTPPPKVEAPKEEPKPTLGQLEEKTGRAMFDAMNTHDAKKLASLYATDAVIKMPGAPSDPTGRDAIEKSWQDLFTAFPDFKSAPSRIFVKNDVVITEWAMNGTHKGDLMGGIKATEKPVGIQGVDVLWFNPDGSIKEDHHYLDVGTVMSQIGVSPAKARPIPSLPAQPQVFGMGPAGADEQKNTDALNAMLTALDAKKEADFVGTLADNVEYDDMTQPTGMKGKADGKKFLKETTTGFPDAKHAATNTWAMGDYVVAEGTMTGTHKGTFFGIPATKKPVNLRSVSIFQYKDGKMVHGWTYANGADFMMQIGKMPAPGAAKPGAAPAGAGAKPPVTTAKPADPKAAPKK
jgi:steroid delta-isomerase-like uncharacterized protein